MTDTLGPAMQSLLDAAETRLEDCGVPAGHVILAPGNNVVWDNCCGDRGQLWVRAISVLPQPQGSQACDITDLQVRLALGVVRCMHGLDDDGKAPTAGEMRSDTLQMTRDADLLLQAIRTWEMTPFINPKSLRVEQGLPLGPLGYCGGWEWTLVFRLLMCAGC